MKRKRTYTRRGKAFRRLSFLLILLLLGHITGVYYVLPSQALHSLVRREAVGDVDIVRTLYDPELRGTPLMRYYLCENDDVLMLGGTRFYFSMGWQYDFAATASMAGDAPVKAGGQSFSRDGEDKALYVFGRVDDPRAARVTVETEYYIRYGGDIRQDSELYPLSVEIPAGAYTEHEGKTYFLYRADEIANPDFQLDPGDKVRYVGQYNLRCYDAEGALLGETRDIPMSWTHFG
ncbi:MAG: hypothetical protein ACOX81_01280 [Candidatus Heteroscillospira sp.]|jgi:hypothetical protein